MLFEHCGLRETDDTSFYGVVAGARSAWPVLFVDADGEHRLAADALYGPNELTITPDGETLIVAEYPQLDILKTQVTFARCR